MQKRSKNLKKTSSNHQTTNKKASRKSIEKINFENELLNAI